MRVILTLIAVALVTLLTTALIVPYFVDWSAHRAEIAERLQDVTGGRVTLNGPVTLRLLPTPYLEVGAGSATGARPDAPRLAFDGARLELALVKLASGAFRFTDVRLEKPVLTLSRSADGALVLPAAASTRAEAVGADRFSVRDGTIRIAGEGGGPGWTIEGVDLDGDAPTLAGPYHVNGRASGPGGAPIVFRLASEKAGPGGAPVRIAVEAGPVWPALEFDGALAGSGTNGPSLLGAAVITGTAQGVDGPTPWRAVGKLAADLDGATLTGAEFRFGPEERALRAEGSASLAMRGGTRVTVDAKAREANVDALLRRNGEDAAPPSRAAAALSAVLAPALDGARTARVEARVAVETVILGGDTISGLSAALKAEPGAPPTARFELGLPGESRIKAEGEVETGAAARFVGAIDFSTGNPGGLGRWASEGAPELAAFAQALEEAVPASRFAVSGQVEAATVGVSGRNLRIALGRSVLTGALAVTRPVGGDPGRIYADLGADSLDLDALPSFQAARSLIDDYDLSLSLEAKALSLAHVGEAGIDGASLVLKVGRTGPNLTLDRLAIAGLGGAALEATGAAGPNGVTAAGRLDADKLADFVALVSRLAPGPWARTLIQRAPLLSPASIAFEARGGPASEGAPALEALKATGTLASTRAALSLEPAARGGGQAFSIVLDSPDSGALAQQLGLGRAAAPVAAGQAKASQANAGQANAGQAKAGQAKAGQAKSGSEKAGQAKAGQATAGQETAGHMELHGSGAWDAGFDVDAAASLAGAALTGRGRFAPKAQGDEARLFGAFRVAGDNIAPLATLFGVATAGGAIGPVEASADVTLRGERWTASRIAATVAGVKASGALAYEAPAAPGETVASPDLERAEEAVDGPAAAAPAAVTGEVSLDRLRLADLAALALGPPQPASAGKVWSEAKFAAPPLTLPAAAVRVHVGTLNFSDALAGQGFSTSLRFGGGRLDLDDVSMQLDGAAVSGRTTLRRSGDTATLDGALTVEPVPVRRPGFSGRVGGRLDVASTGRSPAALVAGLAGGGTAEFSGAALARSDPAALERVVAAGQAPEAQIDETNVAYLFAAALDKGPFAIPDGSAPIALSGGSITVGPIAVPLPRGAATLTANFDLVRPALETRLALAAPATGLKFWSGPDPSATVTVEDALDAPKRRVDVAGLAAGLATQAIARESDRIASLEADIRERAFFNRRLKGERFLDRRNAEIEDWRAEQDRLKGLEQHLAAQRAEAERLAAEKAAAEKAAAEEAAAEKAAAEKGAAEKAAAEKAAAEKASAERSASSPERQPDAPESAPDLAGPPSSAASTGRDEVDGAPPGIPAPPPRPRPRPERSAPPEPTAGGLY